MTRPPAASPVAPVAPWMSFVPRDGSPSFPRVQSVLNTPHHVQAALEVTSFARRCLSSKIVVVSADAFGRLRPGHWLSDCVVDAFLFQLQQRAQSQRQRVLVFNSFFVTMLRSHGASSARRWANPDMVLAQDMLVVSANTDVRVTEPIHLSSRAPCVQP